MLRVKIKVFFLSSEDIPYAGMCTYKSNGAHTKDKRVVLLPEDAVGTKNIV